MEEIIFQIRRFSAPFDGGLILTTPAEVQINFYKHGNINPHIPKLKRCVINRVTVDYAPQGEWSTFRNGYPVAASMILDVTEMEIITRQAVQDGF